MNKKNPSVCFVGLENLPVLLPEFNHHGIGGEQVQQTLLAKAMARHGYIISMVVGDYGQKDGRKCDGVTTYKAYKFSEGFPVVRYIYPRWTKLWSALKRADADVYYVSCASMQVGLVVMFAKLNRKKVIFRIASDADCDPANLLIKYWRDKKLYEYGLRRVTQILAQSQQQQKNLFINYGLNSSLATMMVDNSIQDYDFCKREIKVLWVSNLRHLKRPDLALELASNIPEHDVHMIGGPIGGLDTYYSQIKEESDNIDNLYFHGRIAYHDINDYFQRAKVFINTSDTEGFPNSYLQSWIRGTPVIAFFDPDGIIEREGLGVAVETIEEMIEVVKLYVTDAKIWKSASERCKSYMAREYGEDKILAPYITAFYGE